MMFRLIAMLVLVCSGTAQAVTWSDFLRGHWRTDCKRDGAGLYYHTGYTFSDFSGPEFQIIMQGTAYFFDSKCTKLQSFNQVLGHLNLVATDTPMKGAKIKWQIDPLIQYPLAAYDKKKVAELNQKAYCGQTDWQLGKAKELLETTCAKEIKFYYLTNWFSLEVTDSNTIRLADKSGSKEDIRRSVFTLPKPLPRSF